MKSWFCHTGGGRSRYRRLLSNAKLANRDSGDATAGGRGCDAGVKQTQREARCQLSLPLLLPHCLRRLPLAEQGEKQF